jgi:hypothetical protein
VSIDDAINISATADCEITGDGQVRPFVVAAREDIEIAQAVRAGLPQLAVYARERRSPAGRGSESSVRT